MSDQIEALETWSRELCTTLGLANEVIPVDVPLLLDVSKEAAHAVARPAAPITTFLIGMYIGANGGTPEARDKAVTTALELARTFQQ